MEGKQNKNVRVIKAYNPCKTSPTRHSTIYAQQKRYFLSKSITTCPREKFKIDLCEQINKWHNKNDRIILLIDLNKNATRKDGPLLQSLLRDVNLIDPIAQKRRNLLPPVTQNRGSCKIDTMLTSVEAGNIINGGWLAFGDGIGDHRAG